MGGVAEKDGGIMFDFLACLILHVPRLPVCEFVVGSGLGEGDVVVAGIRDVGEDPYFAFS